MDRVRDPIGRTLRFLARKTRGGRGQSLVELAMTLPILTTLLMGIIDLSFVLYGHIQVAAAAGEGARAGALFNGDYTLSVAQNDYNRAQAIRNAIYNPGTGTTAMGMLKTTGPSFNVASSDVSITYDPPSPVDPNNTSRSGDRVVVTVTYRQPLWFDLIPGQVSNMLSVSSTTRMRMQ